jgi:hypothetical protein
MRREDPVEIALPAQGAVDELGGQRHVARGERAPFELGVERQVGEGRIGVDALEHACGHRSRRRGGSGHRDVSV